MAETKGTKLPKLIKDMETSLQNYEEVMKQYKNKYYATILQEIGKATAYDTGVTRDMLQKVISNDLGQPQLARALDTDIYEHWNTLEERLQEENTANLSISNGKYTLNINSDSFTFLNTTPNSVSVVHPRGIDESLHPFMIDYVLDKLEADAIPSLTKIQDDMEKATISAFEGRKVTYKGNK